MKLKPTMLAVLCTLVLGALALVAWMGRYHPISMDRVSAGGVGVVNISVWDRWKHRACEIVVMRSDASRHSDPLGFLDEDDPFSLPSEEQRTEHRIECIEVP